MNDLKLLFANEIRVDVEKPIDLVTFDSNMARIYASDHDKIYEIDLNDSKVNLDNLNLNSFISKFNFSYCKHLI